MGKTYKSQSDSDYLNDQFDDLSEMDLNFDEDMDLYLEKHMTGQLKRGKGSLNRKKNLAYDDESQQHRLPRDWRDFDYTSDSQLNEEWG